MENQNKVLLTVIGAATLLVAVVGATFAYFSAIGSETSVQVQTGSSQIAIQASEDVVENIRPTSWTTRAEADAEVAKNNVEKFTLTVSGAVSGRGTYTISMNKPEIAIKNIAGDKGDLSDIRYAIFRGEETTAVKQGNFADATFTEGKVDLVVDEAYQNSVLSGEFTVYVWIENENADQNNLQEVSFKLTFAANATSGNQ